MPKPSTQPVCKFCGQASCYCCPECGCHVAQEDHKPGCTVAPPKPCVRPDCPNLDCLFHCQGAGCGKTIKEGHDYRCPILRAMPPCTACRGLGRDKNNVPCLLCDGYGRWGSGDTREVPAVVRKERVKKERPGRAGKLRAAGVDALF